MSLDVHSFLFAQNIMTINNNEAYSEYKHSLTFPVLHYFVIATKPAH